jgi:hypothetical protein
VFANLSLCNSAMHNPNVSDEAKKEAEAKLNAM